MKNNKGITLIALVITIIVMLILVAVTITMAVNGGLFEYASKATKNTQNEIIKDQELANLAPNLTVEDLIDKYTGETTEIVSLPDDFFLYSNSTTLIGINSKYLFETTQVSNILEEGVKIASTQPILLADSLKTESVYYEIYVDGVEVCDIIIPEGVQQINTNAFQGILSIQNIELPETLSTIQYGAFINCKFLETITIPSSVTYVEANVFYGCPDTATVSVAFTEGNKPSNWNDYWAYGFYGIIDYAK